MSFNRNLIKLTTILVNVYKVGLYLVLIYELLPRLKRKSKKT